MGTILVAGSAVAYSFAGFFTRLIPLDVATLLFWRGLFAGATIAGLVLAQHGRASLAALRAIGGGGVLVAALSALASYLYLAAFRHTTVADVSIIYATLPLVTAALAWALLRERAGGRAIAASLVALAGSAVMLGGAIGHGNLLGDALAFAMTAAFALMMVLIRRARAVSMLPAVGLSCFLTSALTWPVAMTGPLASLPLLHLALFGAVQLGLGLVLLTLGMRRMPAGRAALIGLLDTPLAPIWVWLAFDEVPPAATLLGGAIVLGAVLWHTAGERTA